MFAFESHSPRVVLAPPTLIVPSVAFVKSPRVILRVPVLSVMTSIISSIFAAPISKLPLIVKVSSWLKSVIVILLTCAEISIVSDPSPPVTVVPVAFTVMRSLPVPAFIESEPPLMIVSLLLVA